MRMSSLAATLLAALLVGSAGAQEVRLYRADEAVDPQEVARILGDAARPAFKLRSLRLLDPPSASSDAAPSAGAARGALALPVQFGFDSSDILPAARAQLDALAAGIRLLPDGKVVVIEGHTDATGSEQYNNLLSQRRALAIKQYLVAMQGINAQRLHTVGLGKDAPLPGRDPYAPENRRVQFHGE